MASTIKCDTIQTDTGNIAFSTVASERLRIDNNGNVGIGTTSPTSLLSLSRSTECVLKLTNTGVGSSWVILEPSSSGAGYIHNISNAPTIFSTNTVERMRIDSSGNVGIGTTSPSTYGKFAVVSSTAGAAKISIQDTSGGSASPLLQFGLNDTSGFNTSDASRIWTTAASSTVASLNFSAYNNGAPSAAQMTLTGGNVGIGLTPNAWSGSVVLQMTGPSLWGSSGLSHLSTNTYFDGTNYKYIATNFVTDYYQLSGTHVWRYAASGTAGTNVSSLNEAMRIDSSGNLLVGTTSLFTGTYAVNIMGAAGNRAYLGMKRETASTSGACGSIQSFNGTNAIASIDFQSNGANNSGFIQTYTWSAGSSVQGPYVNTGGTSWTTASDETLKDIIAPIEEATSKLSGLRTVFGKYKTDHDDVRRIFLIAQDVQAVLPEAVSTDGNGKLGLNYQDLVPVLVKAIQEQQALITALTARIEALENK